ICRRRAPGGPSAAAAPPLRCPIRCATIPARARRAPIAGVTRGLEPGDSSRGGHTCSQSRYTLARADRRRSAMMRRPLPGKGLAAAIATATGQPRRATLSVKPVLCITDRREEGCATSVLVVWRSDGAGNYCLHSELAAEPLRCWQLAASGMLMEELVVQQTFSYWLTDAASGARLAEATFDVMTTDADDRRRSRRRRHVWDFL